LDEKELVDALAQEVFVALLNGRLQADAGQVLLRADFRFELPMSPFTLATISSTTCISAAPAEPTSKPATARHENHFIVSIIAILATFGIGPCGAGNS
jgi:hypothetical protein